jgi:hypothetical protein
MRTLIRFMVAVMSSLAIVSMADAAGVFTATLTGAAERPNPVTTNTQGRARVVFNADDTQAEFQLQVQQGVNITQAHIHCGGPEAAGPVVAFLAGLNPQGYNVNALLPWIFGATLTDTSVVPRTAQECGTPITNLRELIALIRSGNAYANVHSVANTGGEVRGQLTESQ